MLIGSRKNNESIIICVGHPHNKVRHLSIAGMIDPSMILSETKGTLTRLETVSMLDLVPENCLDPEDTVSAPYIKVSRDFLRLICATTGES